MKKTMIILILLLFVFTRFNAYAVDLTQPRTGSCKLVITTSGPGQVNVVAKGKAAICGPGCKSYPYGTKVILTAATEPCNTFSGWGGSCSGSVATCSLIMNQGRNVTATFAPPQDEIGVSQDHKCPDCYYCKAVLRGTSIYCKAGNIPQAITVEPGWANNCDEVAKWCRDPNTDKESDKYKFFCTR